MENKNCCDICDLIAPDGASCLLSYDTGYPLCIGRKDFTCALAIANLELEKVLNVKRMDVISVSV